MRVRSLGVAALVLFMAGPGFAQEEWAEYVSRTDGFKCNFPGEPQITETTFRSEYGADLPARVYGVMQGQSRYSVMVVDYGPIERILTEKSKACPAGAEPCRGDPRIAGYGYWQIDVRGATTYATWLFLQRDAKLTHLMWNNTDLVAGNQLQMTNRDESRSFVAIYMHENRLYILEGRVPKGYPDPGLFQQSLGFVDKDGNGIRYQFFYSYGFPAPPRTQGGQGGGQGVPPR